MDSSSPPEGGVNYRHLRRYGCARLEISVGKCLFGEIAVAYSLRRIAWAARDETRIFPNEADAMSFARRSLYRDSVLIRRLARLLDDGVRIRILMIASMDVDMARFSEEIRDTLLILFDDSSVQVCDLITSGDREYLTCDIRRRSLEGATGAWKHGGNVVPFRARSVSIDTNTELGRAFVGERSLTRLAAWLYPLDVRRVCDLQGQVMVLVSRSLRKQIALRTLIDLEGWLDERGVIVRT